MNKLKQILQSYKVLGESKLSSKYASAYGF